MKTLLTQDNNSRRLILLYTGWAMDPHPFMLVGREGYDTMVVWDYTTLEFDPTPMRRYDEIVVVAWSFGVFAAAASAHHLPAPVTCRIAIAGTLYPISDDKGIPEAIFWATLDNLSEASLRKFYRRMFHDAGQYHDFIANAPHRGLEDMRNELEAMPGHIRQASLTNMGKRWDYALIPEEDRIFPPDNQRRAWANNATSILAIPGAHKPSIARIIDKYVIDKELVRRRFGRAASSYDMQSSIQAAMAGVLARHLEALCPHELEESHNVLEIGCGTGHLTNAVWPLLPDDSRMRLWDLVDYHVARPEGTLFEARDAEMGIRDLPYRSLDLIVSGATLQWFNSPGAFLVRAARTLRPGGILAFSTFSRGNLREVSEIAGDALPFIAYGRLDSLVPDDMDVILMKQATVVRHFPEPGAVLEHLRLTGVNAVATHAQPLKLIHRIIREYPRVEIGPHAGECPLTYCPIYVILKKKNP